MQITKHLPLATMEVDPKAGVIWINSPLCVLRISKVKFKHIVEKFSMIDIVENEAVMVKEGKVNEFEDNLNGFLVQLVQILHLRLQEKSSTAQKQYYKKLLKEIKNMEE
jgi:hypothetical protein